MKKLPRDFYLRPTLQVARDLLGKYLVRNLDGTLLVGKIVEVEGYTRDDPASHSFRGRTLRNDVMFWNGGHGYVYFTYGMYNCFNVVTDKKGVGAAVLIRAVEPIQGLETIRKLRGHARSDLDLASGPGKLCIAFAIDRRLNGSNLLGDDLFILEGEQLSKRDIVSTGRVGIRRGADRKWRFLIKGNRFVSKVKLPRQDE
jgi:DNA-3-methyladenine glycosylase